MDLIRGKMHTDHVDLRSVAAVRLSLTTNTKIAHQTMTIKNARRKAHMMLNGATILHEVARHKFDAVTKIFKYTDKSDNNNTWWYSHRLRLTR